MKKSLLVCIAFHYNEDRIDYLRTVVNNFLSYDVAVTIIIDTNKAIDFHFLNNQRISVVVHSDLSHPFHLTCIHREHITLGINAFDVFAYFEDDMLLPYENYLNYLENFKLLWPKCVPAFVRIENKEGDEFISDIPKQQQKEFIKVGGKIFHAFKFPYNYHAFWIMPQKELKQSMKGDFARLSDGREFSAMYVGWELLKPCLVEIEDEQVSKKCYSYHLPNNYALGDGPNGKIRIKDIFI